MYYINILQSVHNTMIFYKHRHDFFCHFTHEHVDNAQTITIGRIILNIESNFKL